MFPGGDKKLEDLRELVEVENLPATCTIGDWLRRMGQDGKGLSGLGRVNRHLVGEILRRDKRDGYSLDVDASVIEAEKEEAKVTYKGQR